MDDIFYYTKLCRRSRKFIRKHHKEMKGSGITITRIDDLLQSGNVPEILRHIEVVPSFQHRDRQSNRVTVYEGDQAYDAVVDFMRNDPEEGSGYDDLGDLQLPPGLHDAATRQTPGPVRFSADNPPDPASVFAEDWKKDDGVVKDEDIDNLLAGRGGGLSALNRAGAPTTARNNDDGVEDPPPARTTLRPNPRAGQTYGKALGR
jgi:hypothetical protein